MSRTVKGVVGWKGRTWAVAISMGTTITRGTKAKGKGGARDGEAVGAGAEGCTEAMDRSVGKKIRVVSPRFHLLFLVGYFAAPT